MIDKQPNNCVTLHLRSAFPLEDLETSAIQESPAGQALPCITRRDNPQRHETLRLGVVGLLFVHLSLLHALLELLLGLPHGLLHLLQSQLFLLLSLIAVV